MQIFSRSPRGGTPPPLPEERLRRFDAGRRAAGIDPLVIHAPYIINLASPEASVWARSAALYAEEYRRAHVLRAQYLVTHVGSHRGEGEAEGIQRVAQAVSRALEAAASSVMILLENTAGSGQGLGYQFEQLAAIRNAVPAKERVGICLDTAHLFAAGYPIHTAEGLTDVIAAFDRTVGLPHVKVIHLNDSKVPFGSRVDRHWHIGEGHIGREAFRRILTHPQLVPLAWILETPKTTDAEDARNLSVVRSLAGLSGRVPSPPSFESRPGEMGEVPHNGVNRRDPRLTRKAPRGAGGRRAAPGAASAR